MKVHHLDLSFNRVAGSVETQVHSVSLTTHRPPMATGHRHSGCNSFATLQHTRSALFLRIQAKKIPAKKVSSVTYAHIGWRECSYYTIRGSVEIEIRSWRRETEGPVIFCPGLRKIDVPTNIYAGLVY